jgi:hypothetical protein
MTLTFWEARPKIGRPLRRGDVRGLCPLPLWSRSCVIAIGRSSATFCEL